MKNRYLLLIIFILSIVAVNSSRGNKTSAFILDEPKLEEKQETNLQISVKDVKTNDINKMDLEDYVIGVVAAEMPASFAEEALKAQAIASRTYAVYKMNHSNREYAVLTDISDQAYITKEEMLAKWPNNFTKYYEKIKKAVDDTKNMVMMYDNEVIIAYYFAMSNGYTEDAALVFGNKTDYLESVDSNWDKDVKNFEVTKEISKEDFCQKLGINCKDIKITKIEKSPTGRVNSLIVNDKEFKGTTFRQLLGLRSTDFTISIAQEAIKITTKGYGHGVGMSQYGAQEMAKLGYNYEEILKYYYHDIELSKV